MGRRRSAGDDIVFKALAHPRRRRIIERLHRSPGQTLKDLCRNEALTRQAFTQHVDVLAEAGLIVTRWMGREKLHYLNAIPLEEVYRSWIAQFASGSSQALVDLRTQLEERGAPVKKHIKKQQQ